jgi:hypothetical protein
MNARRHPAVIFAAAVLLLVAVFTVPLFGPGTHWVERRARNLARTELSSWPEPLLGKDGLLSCLVEALQVVVYRYFRAGAAVALLVVLQVLGIRILGDVFRVEVRGALLPVLVAALFAVLGVQLGPEDRKLDLRYLGRFWPELAGFALGGLLVSSTVVLGILMTVPRAVSGQVLDELLAERSSERHEPASL